MWISAAADSFTLLALLAKLTGTPATTANFFCGYCDPLSLLVVADVAAFVVSCAEVEGWRLLIAGSFVSSTSTLVSTVAKEIGGGDILTGVHWVASVVVSTFLMLFSTTGAEIY